jgi:hypothetical protein
MVLGIVGAEAAKFTAKTEAKARVVIRALFTPEVTSVVSGACHLGGIDIWAIEEAQKHGLPTLTFPARHHSWSAGYMPRNIKIAETSDTVVCVVVKELPAGYTGMRFRLCYHCGTTDHVKSGGCWTVKHAKRLGKLGLVVIV